MGFGVILVIFLGFGGILVIFGFGGILVIFWVSGVFWSIFGFVGILLILDLGVFWSFFKILEYFDHFHFSGILVILIVG